MTPTFRYPTHELLFVSRSAASIPAIRAAVSQAEPAIALTTLTRPECLTAHLQAEDSTFPDLIVLDLSVPDLLVALTALKGETCLREIPVAAIVQEPTPEATRAVYQAHANCCLTPPRDEDDFINLMQELVRYWFQVACLPSRSSRQQTSTLDW